jgi:thymidine kinase
MKRLVMIFLGLSMICNGACEQESQGSLTVICGPMCSGKTEELIRRINICKIAGIKLLVCKHSFDTRVLGKLSCRSNLAGSTNALAIMDPRQIADMSGEAETVAIDEVQFFDYGLIPVVQRLLFEGKRIIVSGLDMDFKREPFGECMPALLCMAHEIVKLKAVCQVCKQYNAVYSQRLVNGVEASLTDNVVIVDNGSSVYTYEPRCIDCHKLTVRRSKSLDFLGLFE